MAWQSSSPVDEGQLLGCHTLYVLHHAGQLQVELDGLALVIRVVRLPGQRRHNAQARTKHPLHIPQTAGQQRSDMESQVPHQGTAGHAMSIHPCGRETLWRPWQSLPPCHRLPDTASKAAHVVNARSGCSQAFSSGGRLTSRTLHRLPGWAPGQESPGPCGIPRCRHRVERQELQALPALQQPSLLSSVRTSGLQCISVQHSKAACSQSLQTGLSASGRHTGWALYTGFAACSAAVRTYVSGRHADDNLKV